MTDVRSQTLVLAMFDTTAAAPCAALDRITETAALVLNAPMALITQVDEDRQVFLSAAGAQGQGWRGLSTDISRSVCRHVLRGGAVLAIDDLRRHASFAHHPAVGDLGVVAYLGAPVLGRGLCDDAVLCVIDSRPRKWSGAQCRLVETLADAVSTERALSALQDERDALFRSLSHEIRTPLNGVLGGLSLIEADCENAACARYLGIVRASATDLLRAAETVLEEMAARRALAQRR